MSFKDVLSAAEEFCSEESCFLKFIISSLNSFRSCSSEGSSDVVEELKQKIVENIEKEHAFLKRLNQDLDSDNDDVEQVHPSSSCNNSSLSPSLFLADQFCEDDNVSVSEDGTEKSQEKSATKVKKATKAGRKKKKPVTETQRTGGGSSITNLTAQLSALEAKRAGDALDDTDSEANGVSLDSVEDCVADLESEIVANLDSNVEDHSVTNGEDPISSTSTPDCGTQISEHVCDDSTAPDSMELNETDKDCSNCAAEDEQCSSVQNDDDEIIIGNGKSRSSRFQKENRLLRTVLSAQIDSDDDFKKRSPTTRKAPQQTKKHIVDSSGESSKEQSRAQSVASDSPESEVSEDEASPHSSSDDFRSKKPRLKKETKAQGKTKGRCNKGGRKRVKLQDSSSGGEEEEASEKNDDDKSESARRKIRKILKGDKLSRDTKRAEEIEKLRRKRIEERQQLYNLIEVCDDQDALVKCTKISRLVLEKDPDSGDVLVEVHPKIVEVLKPHQAEGIQFMYDNTIESMDKANEPGAGCILAHCMGLGKTLQVVSFVHTVLSCKRLKLKTCLIICPLNTVLNWVAEFRKWLDEDDDELSVNVWELTGVTKNYDRIQNLKEWREEGGILILGYEQFRNLANAATIKNKKQKQVVQQCLLDPGPDLCVCDEGHILKNETTAISKVTQRIKTLRRVCLTGTPLQNNLAEYHTMVNFVKPNLLGTKKEFLNRFVNPIKNGQCSDSTARDVRIMKRRAHVLHQMLSGCVQRKDYSALLKFLPPKYEYVLSVRLSDKQIQLYRLYLESVVGDTGADALRLRKSLFADFQVLQRVWTHPYALVMQQEEADKRALREEQRDELEEFIDDETESDTKSYSDASSGDEKSKKRRNKNCSNDSSGFANGNGTDEPGCSKANKSDDDAEPELIRSYSTRTRGLTEEDIVVTAAFDKPATPAKQWWSDFVNPEEDKCKADLSGKLLLLLEIIRKCEAIGDKLLVFSQSLISLNLIEILLSYYEDVGWEASQDSLAAIADERWGWTPGVDYYRLDGSTPAEKRRACAESFNDPTNLRSRLFLISTKAGGLGINLVGANRVVIFDASWNPSHDIQSIFRVYRFGQTKPVYIYRFIAQGTMEEKIYDRQVTKQSLAARVVDEQQIERHFTSGDLEALYSFSPDECTSKTKKTTPLVPKDLLLADLLAEQRERITTYHEHDSLLENIAEEELTEEERQAAWEEYDNEKRGRIAAWNNSNIGLGGIDLTGSNDEILARLMAYGDQLVRQSGQNTSLSVRDVVEQLKAKPEFIEDRGALVTKVIGIVTQVQQMAVEARRAQQQAAAIRLMQAAPQVYPAYPRLPGNMYNALQHQQLPYQLLTAANALNRPVMPQQSIFPRAPPNPL